MYTWEMHKEEFLWWNNVQSSVSYTLWDQSERKLWLCFRNLPLLFASDGQVWHIVYTNHLGKYACYYTVQQALVYESETFCIFKQSMMTELLNMQVEGEKTMRITAQFKELDWDSVNYV